MAFWDKWSCCLAFGPPKICGRRPDFDSAWQLPFSKSPFSIFSISQGLPWSPENRRSMIPVTTSQQIGWMILRWMILKLQNQHLGFNIVWCCPLVGHFIPPQRLTAWTWKWWFGRWFSFSRGVFSGSMLIFWGVVWYGLNCFLFFFGLGYKL